MRHMRLGITHRHGYAEWGWWKRARFDGRCLRNCMLYVVHIIMSFVKYLRDLNPRGYHAYER